MTGSAQANVLTLSTSTNSGFSGALSLSNVQMALSNGGLTTGLTSANLPNVGSVSISNGGGLNIDTSGSLQANRVNDSAPISLHNTQPHLTITTVGLNYTSDQVSLTAPRVENVGVVTLASGTNTLRVNATAAGAVAQLSLNSLVRSNNATLVVLATNMEDPIAGRRGDVVVANPASILNALAGGGSTVGGTPNISILPWALGSNAGVNATAAGSLGNTFVTYSTYGGLGNGFRALTNAEYEQLGANGGTTLASNARYASNGINLNLTGVNHRVNSLLVDNTSTTTALTVSGSGGGDSLVVNSGAFLFLGSATPQGISITGFNGGIALGTGRNEYVFHQLNRSAAGVTISDTLTTAGAGITKSGDGLLVLTGTNTAITGPITLNQGLIRITDLDNIGGDAGGQIIFRGGGLQIGAGFTDDFSTRTAGLRFQEGGLTSIAGLAGILPVSGNIIDTNGVNTVLNVALSGTDGFTKAGAGNLVLSGSGASTLGGAVSVIAGELQLAPRGCSSASIRT